MKSHLGSNKLRPDLIVCIGFYGIFVFQGATQASWQKFLNQNNLHILNDWERWFFAWSGFTLSTKIGIYVLDSVCLRGKNNGKNTM